MITKKNYEMDMTQGATMPKLLRFAMPLMLSSVLQLLFNAADIIVVGHFDPNGSIAVGAVGSTGSLINLLVTLFIGLSVGTNVVIARDYGAGKYKEASQAVHTSVAMSIGFGVIIGIFGYFCAGTFLKWMESPDEVLPLASTYLRIYFLGMPFNMFYNFGAAVLRAVGDTRRPMVYLSIAGVFNVVLNLFFVIVFHMGVAGVALATIVSQAISAVLVFICLLRSEGVVHVDLRKIRITGNKCAEIIRIGLPAGLQSTCFSISNVLIQSTVNSFGTLAVAGNSVSANLESFISVASAAMHQAAVTFTSQNVGAKRNDRLRKICIDCVLFAVAFDVVVGAIMILFRVPLLSIYTSEADTLVQAQRRLKIMIGTYFMCGAMDVICGAIRGLGSTVTPMVVTLTGACGLRLLWIFFVFPFNPTIEMLYLSYPISWTITTAAHVVTYLHFLKKFPVAKTLS